MASTDQLTRQSNAQKRITQESLDHWAPVTCVSETGYTRKLGNRSPDHSTVDLPKAYFLFFCSDSWPTYTTQLSLPSVHCTFFAKNKSQPLVSCFHLQTFGKVMYMHSLGPHRKPVGACPWLSTTIIHLQHPQHRVLVTIHVKAAPLQMKFPVYNLRKQQSKALGSCRWNSWLFTSDWLTSGNYGHYCHLGSESVYGGSLSLLLYKSGIKINKSL